MKKETFDCGAVMEQERVFTYGFDYLGKSVFPVMLYVGPTREYYCEYEDCIVKDMITDEVFQELSSLGVNAICGHHREFEGHEESIRILELCNKYRMVYLPRYDDRGFAYYDSEKKQIVTYKDFSEEKKNEAKQKFIDFLNLYKDYPSFGGICAGDETGMDIVPAFVEMKKIFDSVCPNKLFFINMVGPDSEKQLWLKFNPFCSEAEADGLVSPDSLTWLDMMYNYANTVGLDVMCFDNYIFWNHTIRPVLLRDVDRMRRGCFSPKPLWYALLNGQEGEALTGQTKEETFYQTNLVIAAGCSGVMLYPGFSPIECGASIQKAFYDRKSGEKTEYYYWYKELFAHVHKCENVLMNSTYKGLIKTGINGGEICSEKVIQLEEHLEKQGTGDCVVHTSMLLDSFNQLVGVYSTKAQVVIGCYNYGGYSALYLANNSASINTEVTLRFNKEVNVYSVENAIEKRFANVSSITKHLKAGEGVMYVLDNE